MPETTDTVSDNIVAPVQSEAVQSVSEPTCDCCSETETNCECQHCGTCRENRHSDDMCSNCERCTYNGCCECWSCSNCQELQAEGAPCSNCERCSECCDCCECPNCNRNTRSGYLCQSCEECENCCHCNDQRNIEFIRPPREPFFHKATNVQHKVNPSSRYISAEIEVAETRVGAEDTTSPPVKKWNGGIVEDGSLPASGFEINTAPASGDLYVNQIHDICEGLAEQNGKATKACGLHIHVDARDYNFYDVRKLAFLYEKIEDALFGIVAPSRKASHYCQPCGKKYVRELENNTIPKDNEKKILENVYGSKDVDLERVKGNKYNEARYGALNVHSWVYRGSIEFRMHHGTVNEEKITNWGILLAGIVDYAYDNSEKKIKTLKGDPLSILLSIAPSDKVKEWVTDRYKYFKERAEGTATAGELGE